MSNVNVPKLRKAVEWVEEQDKIDAAVREWDQGSWVSRFSIDTQRGQICGTAYCVAGYIGHLDGVLIYENGHETSEVKLPNGGEVPVCHYAMDELGLDVDQANELFSALNDAEDIRRIAEQIAGEKL